MSWLKKHLRLVVILLALVICLVGIVLCSLLYGVYYRHWESPMARGFISALHLPAAKVGSLVISYDDFLTNLDAEKRFVEQTALQDPQTQIPTETELRSQAMNQALRVAAVADFSAQRGVNISSDEIDKAYDGIVARAGTSTTPEQFEGFLQSMFGWDKTTFKHFVVGPALLEEALRAKQATEWPDDTLFEKAVQDRLGQSDVVRYIKL